MGKSFLSLSVKLKACWVGWGKDISQVLMMAFLTSGTQKNCSVFIPVVIFSWKFRKCASFSFAVVCFRYRLSYNFCHVSKIPFKSR